MASQAISMGAGRPSHPVDRSASGRTAVDAIAAAMARASFTAAHELSRRLSSHEMISLSERRHIFTCRWFLLDLQSFS